VKQLMYEIEAKVHMDNHESVVQNLYNIDIEFDYLVNNYLEYLYQLVREISFRLNHWIVRLLLMIIVLDKF
jgi:hypothetical protein